MRVFKGVVGQAAYAWALGSHVDWEVLCEWAPPSVVWPPLELYPPGVIADAKRIQEALYAFPRRTPRQLSLPHLPIRTHLLGATRFDGDGGPMFVIRVPIMHAGMVVPVATLAPDVDFEDKRTATAMHGYLAMINKIARCLVGEVPAVGAENAAIVQALIAQGHFDDIAVKGIESWAGLGALDALGARARVVREIVARRDR